MIKKLTILLAVAVALTVVSGMALFAQTSAVPDVGVRGTGIVTFAQSTTSFGQFDINAARIGPTFVGGFKWTEVSTVPTATFVRPPVIISKQITGLRLTSPNRAVIEAIGFFNDRPAAITMDCIDSPDGDTIHITATNIVPAGSALPTVLYYDRYGTVSKGNLVVYSKPIPASFAKGTGVIKVNATNSGQFSFSATSVPAGVSGGLHYVDFNSMVMSPMIKPYVVIDVRAFATLTVDGNSAVMTGPGVINGVPATVTVKVADLAKPGSTTTVLDTFSIEAVPTSTGPITPGTWTAAYKAGGPVVRGDIVVGTIAPATP